MSPHNSNTYRPILLIFSNSEISNKNFSSIVSSMKKSNISYANSDFKLPLSFNEAEIVSIIKSFLESNESKQTPLKHSLVLFLEATLSHDDLQLYFANEHVEKDLSYLATSAFQDFNSIETRSISLDDAFLLSTKNIVSVRISVPAKILSEEINLNQNGETPMVNGLRMFMHTALGFINN